MTGAYLRVKRDGKWQPIEVEHLTKEERRGVFQGRDFEELMRWMDGLCDAIKETEDSQPDPRL